MTPADLDAMRDIAARATPTPYVRTGECSVRPVHEGEQEGNFKVATTVNGPVATTVNYPDRKDRWSRGEAPKTDRVDYVKHGQAWIEEIGRLDAEDSVNEYHRLSGRFERANVRQERRAAVVAHLRSLGVTDPEAALAR